MVPESQVSSPRTLPSQQIGVQIEGDLTSPPWQVQPSINWEQRELHIDSLLRFPSSQSSFPTLLASPHMGIQVVGRSKSPPEQAHSGLFLEQSGRHPVVWYGIEWFKYPSSQASVMTLPSPQMELQSDVPFDYKWHSHPTATPWHPIKHPTPSFDWSSQVSVPTKSPSPQIGLQMSGPELEPPEQIQPVKAP